ncbi:PAS domain S-box-containing protein [Neorhizobium galegae]|uniref:PAS domain-containing protein n=1 Tax=Neorhizobium galegae TaxID=399 RepID=UPI001AEAC57B|nr:PAS domain-containing protein [Neorhizobium galegae]MBP2551185.1 PAS domain S-box-containing protein [Neorhizobium galegae]
MTVSDRSIKDAEEAGERLLAEHRSDDPFAAAFKATRMPMIITDPRQADNPIIFSNAAFSTLTGYAREELIGRNCRLLQGPQTDKAVVAQIRAAVEDERSLAVDVLNYRKDGTPFWNALFLSPVRSQAGDVIYFFASQLDFTRMKERQSELAAARSLAEEEVARRTKDLRDALEAKTLLVHEVDHRVKNNLLTIASILKLQARLTRDDTVRRTLHSVLGRVEALSTVQRKLFTTADVEHFDGADFARDLATDMIGAVRRDDIELTFNLSPVLIPAAKASPLAFILHELVADAVRRGLGDGGGKLHLCVERLNGQFHIEMRDTAVARDAGGEEQDFSRMILETCARQVGATITREINGSETVVDVLLPVDSHGEGKTS